MDRQNQILEWIRRGLSQFATDLAGFKVVLFGSRARGRPRDRSDFDVGIVGDRPVPLSTFARVGDWLDSLPTLYRIDWVDLNRAAAAVRDNALRKAVVIYE